jgi:hypothetical protein
MDGDISERNLSLATAYGSTAYIRNENCKGNKVFNLMLCEKRWHEQLEQDIQKFKAEDHNFRICIVSQSSSQAVGLERELTMKYPDIRVKKLVGTDDGDTKKEFLEDINKTLEDANVFIYSPVIESGVDITVPVKKVFGLLCSSSNSQRALMQMVARCRNVQEPRMDMLAPARMKVNNNFRFWTFREVLELNREAVNESHGCEFLVQDGHLTFGESEKSKRRKIVSVFNMTEKLNKHPSVYLNYLRMLVEGKGVKWQVDEAVLDPDPGPRRKHYRISAIMGAADVSQEVFDEIGVRKKMGKTTTEENFQWERRYWKRYWKKFFAVEALDDEVLTKFLFGVNPLQNFLSLIDINNYNNDDNLRTVNQMEKVLLIRKLLDGLGFETVVDTQRHVEHEAFMTNFWCNVFDDPTFKRHKRFNELFNLSRSSKLFKDMSPKRVQNWINRVIEPFSLQVVLEREGYRLRVLNDVLGIVRRRNARGQSFFDGLKLLGQTVPERGEIEVEFEDEEEEFFPLKRKQPESGR